MVRLGSLRAAPAAVLLAALPALTALSACASGRAATPAAHSTSTVTAPGSSPGATVATAPGRGWKGATGPTTTASTGRGRSTPTTAASSSSNVVRPPAPGTYWYDTTGKYTYGGRDHALPPRTSLVIDPAAGVSQHASRTLRDVDDNGPVIETTLRYEPDGLYLDLLRETNRVDGMDDTRDYRPNPPVLLAPRTADVGYHASYDAVDGGTTVHVDSDIERMDSVVVDGRAVRCYVVKAVSTFHGTVEGTGTGISCVSVDYRLLLTEDVTTRFSVGPTEIQGAYHAVIEHVTPS